MRKHESDLLNTDKIIVSQPTFRKRFFKFRIDLIILLVIFATLAFFARNYPYFSFDLTITRYVQAFNPSWFDISMRLITDSGFTLPAIIISLGFCLILISIHQRKKALMLFISSFGISLVGFIVKTIIARPRPNPLLINQIEHFTKHDSFPSGHVLQFMGLYGFLLFLVYTELKPSYTRTILLILFSSLVVLIGISRIYVGAHWFSDVSGSYLIGGMWLYLMIYLYKRFNLYK